MWKDGDMPDEQENVSRRLEALESTTVYLGVRSRLVRQAVIWGVIAAAALVISLLSYQSASSAAENGQSQSYFVWWGPVLFGGWRSLKAMAAVRRVDAAAHGARGSIAH